jgi:hypothetical protein
MNIAQWERDGNTREVGGGYQKRNMEWNAIAIEATLGRVE